MVFTSIQKAVLATMEQEREKTAAGSLAREVCGALTAICRREPESAERILLGITSGKAIRDAVKKLKSHGRDGGLTAYQIECGLRDYFELNEPVASEEQE